MPQRLRTKLSIAALRISVYRVSVETVYSVHVHCTLSRVRQCVQVQSVLCNLSHVLQLQQKSVFRTR